MTHQLGGTLDAVVTRDDVGRPQSVAVADISRFLVDDIAATAR